MRCKTLGWAASLLLIAACAGGKDKPAANDESAAGKADAKTDAKTDAKGDANADANADAKAEPKAANGARTWTFDDGGPLPKGFSTAETASAGTPAKWAIEEAKDAPSPPSVFGVVETKNPKTAFNLAIVDDVSMTDVDISVMVKAGTGELDQGGGPIWRITDADNYYIARWNPLENNARFYIVQGGVRSALAKVDIELPTEEWHSLRVVHEGTHMQLFIDDEPVLQAEDAVHAGPGKIGLWTKADAATMFDDLSVIAP